MAIFFVLAGGAAVLAADPPGRVGRLSHIEGTVSLRAADQHDWSAATPNYPVTTGHSLWTEAGARAEIQIGPADVRLNELTELEVVRLDDRIQQFALPQGTVNVQLDEMPVGGLHVETPRGAISFTQPGRFRIDASDASAAGNGDNGVRVTVFEGEARFEASQSPHIVKAGESAVLTGEPTQVALGPAQSTPFDDWALNRDRPIATSKALAHVSPQMTGHQDLDAHGTWERVPDYGPVWYPRVVVNDWAPYRYGHWAYIPPWGWTWIDDAPWGFAPFHYGRWVHIGHRWAWWPGAYVARPVYAPALVTFVGGDGWSVSVAIGGGRPIGWVPLAPYELYRPYYRTSVSYIRVVNVTTVNKTVIKNINVVNTNSDVSRFANRRAATVVSSESFTRGRKAHEAKIEVPERQIEQARVSSDARNLKPVAGKARSEQPAPRKTAAARASEPARTATEPAPQPARKRDGQAAPQPDAKAAPQMTPRPTSKPKQEAPTPAPRPEGTQARESPPTPDQAQEVREPKVRLPRTEQRKAKPESRLEQNVRPPRETRPAPAPQMAPAPPVVRNEPPRIEPPRVHRPDPQRELNPNPQREARPAPLPQAAPVPPVARVERPRAEQPRGRQPDPRPVTQPVAPHHAAPQAPARIEPPQSPARSEPQQRNDQARGGSWRKRRPDEPAG